MIALTDCSPIVMAHELGFFKKFGTNSVVSKEASWAVIRDKLSLGENQATHMLIGMPFASTMGLVGFTREADGGRVGEAPPDCGDGDARHRLGAVPRRSIYPDD